jgi:hypothetical protein
MAEPRIMSRYDYPIRPARTEPYYCGSLSLEAEIDCLISLRPHELSNERIEKLKERLDAILKGRRIYDDGDGLNIDQE